MDAQWDMIEAAWMVDLKVMEIISSALLMVVSMVVMKVVNLVCGSGGIWDSFQVAVLG